MHAAARAYGPNRSVRHPLPRMPRNARLSKSSPCCGTSRASIPSRVPSQNTRQPRAISFVATASPGNTCPPVPPVVIMTVATTPFTDAFPRVWRASVGVGSRRSYGEPAEDLAVLVVDAQQHGHRDTVDNDAAAAERQQR